ncbi:MAG: DUF4893 domain-containing protein [Proteobacteria bacterium]|nr:DUF4893 domain-containing protein [Pseudomonadota bacterium]
MHTPFVLALAVLAAGFGIPALVVPAAAGWREEITLFDQERLAALAESRAQGLAEVDAGGSTADRAAAHAVLDPTPRPITAQDLTGTWRCRTMKLGGLAPAMVYDWFACRFRQTPGGLYFEKLTGTQRISGYADPHDGGFILLGAWTVGDERPKPYSGASPGVGTYTSSRDAAGAITGTGVGRARIEFPYPAIESTFDVIELVR